MEYFFSGILGPWLSLIYIEPHKAKSWAKTLLKWAFWVPCIPVLVAMQVSYCWLYFRSKGYKRTIICGGVATLAWGIVTRFCSKCSAAVGSVISDVFECVAMTLIRICELRPVQQILQLTLLPLFKLITAGAAHVGQLGLRSFWQLVALAAAGVSQVKRVVAASSLRSRKHWDQDVFEALSKAHEPKGQANRRANARLSIRVLTSQGTSLLSPPI